MLLFSVSFEPKYEKRQTNKTSKRFVLSVLSNKPMVQYQGVNILDIPKFEIAFQVNINVYSINDTVIDLERHSSSNYQQS